MPANWFGCKIFGVKLITPIYPEQKQEVIELTRHYIERANDCFGRHECDIPVLFDLSGWAAGMFRVKRGQAEIRYNPYLFAKYFTPNLATTVPHEVAHYIVYRIYGHKEIKPHGIQWQELMAYFNVDASRTCQFDMTGIPVRQSRQYRYHCRCQSHQLGIRRHNRVQRGEGEYICRACGSRLLRTGHG